jgi:tRNA A37 threonylcarbamoyladenosine biosynthesis protein TsaE
MARDNVFKAVEKAFEKFNIVFLDGDVLSGKTEFAAEYTRRNEGKAVAAFLSP